MGNASKSLSLLLIVLLAASSLMIAKPAFAQTPTPTPIPIPTPSVPEFTVQGVGPSYTVPTTYSLNSKTGQVVAQIGYTVAYSYIVVTIKNQPFSRYNDSSGQLISFYYNIQTKLHSSADWTDWYETSDGYPTPSGSEYTVISYNWDGSLITTPSRGVEIPAGNQIDFQVQAMIGSINRQTVVGPNGTIGFNSFPYVFTGETSDWSNTQTVTLPANIPLSPTPGPSSSTSTLTPTPTITSVSSAPNSSLLLIALVVIAFLLAIIIFLLLYMRKRRIIFSQTKTTPTP